MESMRRNLIPGTKMIGVVKADGYGHGAVPVARAIGPYVVAYAAAAAEEALMLRRHGIRKPILILGPVHKSWYEELIKNEIRPVIFTMEQAEALSRIYDVLSDNKADRKEEVFGKIEEEGIEEITGN